MQKTEYKQEIGSLLNTALKMARCYGQIGLMEPDDIAQNSMIRILRRSDQSRPGIGLMLKIVRSAALDACRTIAQEKKYIWQEQNDDLMIVCEEAEANGYRLSGSCLVSENDSEIELMPRLKNVLAQLSGPLRQVLLLFSEGYSYEEIAELTNANVGTVRSRLHYARKKAKEHLSDLGL